MTTDVPLFSQSTCSVLAIQSHVIHGHAGNCAASFPYQVLGVNVDTFNILSFSNHTGYNYFSGSTIENNDKVMTDSEDDYDGNSPLDNKQKETNKEEEEEPVNPLVIQTKKQFDYLAKGLIVNKFIYNYDYIVFGYIGNVSVLNAALDLVKRARRGRRELPVTHLVQKKHNDDSLMSLLFSSPNSLFCPKKYPQLTFVCDPVLGDCGCLYVSRSCVDTYRDTVLPYCDITVPNGFEAGVLSEVINIEPHVYDIMSPYSPDECASVSSGDSNISATIDDHTVKSNGTNQTLTSLENAIKAAEWFHAAPRNIPTVIIKSFVDNNIDKYFEEKGSDIIKASAFKGESAGSKYKGKNPNDDKYIYTLVSTTPGYYYNKNNTQQRKSEEGKTQNGTAHPCRRRYILRVKKVDGYFVGTGDIFLPVFISHFHRMQKHSENLAKKQALKDIITQHQHNQKIVMEAKHILEGADTELDWDSETFTIKDFDFEEEYDRNIVQAIKAAIATVAKVLQRTEEERHKSALRKQFYENYVQYITSNDKNNSTELREEKKTELDGTAPYDQQNGNVVGDKEKKVTIAGDDYGNALADENFGDRELALVLSRDDFLRPNLRYVDVAKVI